MSIYTDSAERGFRQKNGSGLKAQAQGREAAHGRRRLGARGRLLLAVSVTAVADRYCFELALYDPHQHPEPKHVVEIWEPVRSL